MALPSVLRLPLRLGFYAYLRAQRVRAMLSRDQPGVTVVTPAWNSLKYLSEAGAIMMARHAPGIPWIVIDNGSTDGTREWVRQQRRPFRYRRLPHNAGHPLGLDLGFLLARTEYVVALDVDAYPIRADWLEQLIEPLRLGAKLSGACVDNPAISYPYIHPCCLAIRRADFLDGNTFWPEEQDSDVGARMSKRYAAALHKIPQTGSYQGRPGLVGCVLGDIVYHNWCSTRPELYDYAADAWEDALQRYVHGYLSILR